MEQGVLGGSAAGLGESKTVGLHGFFFLEPAESLLEDLGRAGVRRHDDAVVHPLAFAPCGNDARAAKVSEVSGDLWLGLIEDLDEVADADLLFTNEIEEA